MTELHRIPKKQLDASLVNETDLGRTAEVAGTELDQAHPAVTVASGSGLSVDPDQVMANEDKGSEAVATHESAYDHALIGTIVEWQAVPTSAYTATPASTSRITMSDTSGLKVGQALRYAYDGATYYGVVAALSANSYIDVAGAALNVSKDLTSLAFGATSKVVQVDFFVAGTYADGTDDTLLASDMKTAFSWMGPKAYLVAFRVKQKTNDSGTQPKVNVMVNGAAVGTENTNAGPAVDDDWVDCSAVALSTSNYDINRGEPVEVACKAAGGSGDAEHLTVSCLFVLE